MAKKKNARRNGKMENGKPVVDIDEGRGWTEDGVSISKQGNDFGPKIIRKNEDAMAVVTADYQQSVRDRRAPVARRQSHIDRLLSARKIDRRMHDSGEQYKRDYDLAGVGAFMPPRYESVSSSSIGIDIVRGDPRAKNNIHKITERLGGEEALLAKVVRVMIGEEKPLSQLIGDVSLGGKQRKSWDEILIEGLKIIAAFYAPQRGA